jgi:hypothetical protein
VRRDLASALVATALQDVLHFQPQLWVQPVKPNAFVGRTRDLGEAPHELFDVRPVVDLPSVGMAVAKRQIRVRPEIAVIDPAGRAGRGLLDRRRRRQPRVQVGAASTLPPLGV